MIADMDTIRLSSEVLVIVGFAMALLASAWAKHWGYAVLSLVAAIESHVGLRLPFHVWVRDSLLGYPDAPGTKHALQTQLLQFTFAGACIVALLLLPYSLRASMGRRLMLVGMAMTIGMLALELISLHRLDVVIYHPEGPFFRSAIVYFVAAAALTAGALMQRRRSRPEALPSI